MHAAPQLAPALALWERTRIARAAGLQQAGLVNGVVLHLPDGPQQQARDAAMAAEVDDREFTASPNQWSDPRTAAWAYGYDAEVEIRDAFAGWV